MSQFGILRVTGLLLIKQCTSIHLIQAHLISMQYIEVI